MTKRNNPSKTQKAGPLSPTDANTAGTYEFRQKNKSCILFGIVGGSFLTLLSYLRAVSAEGGTVFIWFAFLIAGIILLLTGLIYPLAMHPLQQLIRLIIGWTLRAALTVLLGLVYAVYFIPAGLILRPKRRRMGFYTWKDEAPGEATYLVDSASAKRIKAEKQSVDKKHVIGKKIKDRLSVLKEYRLMLLLPIIIFLVILGILFAFASSGIAEYFIYTLF